METNNLEFNIKCCKMKSVGGYCPRPLEVVSDFLSKKWAISIIVTIGNFSKLRFNKLLDILEGITAKTLSERLKELEKEKIVKRKSYNEMPPRVEYSLTCKGKKLREVIYPLIVWAESR